MSPPDELQNFQTRLLPAYSPLQKQAARELLTRRQARRNLAQFTEYTTPQWQAGKIHRIICDQLDRVLRKEVDRLMLLCPPQHGKSSVTSKRFPAYILGHDPTIDVISASATSELAEGFGREVRNCIASNEYQNLFPGTVLSEDSQAKGRWSTSKGGSYYAVGIGGQLFGRGGMAIIDDPFGTWDDAQSEGQREKVWDWYTGTLYNRIRPGQPIIVIQHRMHEDDLVGKLLAAQTNGGDKWEVINLPANLDDPPWPERYDRQALERIKANTAPMQWSALYLQDPAPAQGVYFKREWFRRYRTLPDGCHKYVASDHAPSGTGDSNCARVWGVPKSGDLYLVDGFRKQCTMDAFTDHVLPLIQRHRPLCWFPENDNNWKAIEGFITAEMRRRNIPCRIEPVSPHGSDKTVKAQSFQGMASMGRVWIPEGPEGDEIIEQYVRFPGGKHDDEVDVAAIIGRALAQAHPGVIPAKDETKPKDRWADRFAEQDAEESWKVL